MIFIKAFRLRHKKKGGGLPPLVRVVSVRAPLPLAPLELAGLAVIRRGLNPSAVQRLLLHPDVVDRLDPLAPRVDPCPVNIAGGGGVREEKGAGAALVYPVGG